MWSLSLVVRRTASPLPSALRAYRLNAPSRDEQQHRQQHETGERHDRRSDEAVKQQRDPFARCSLLAHPSILAATARTTSSVVMRRMHAMGSYSCVRHSRL